MGPSAAASTYSSLATEENNAVEGINASDEIRIGYCFASGRRLVYVVSCLSVILLLGPAAGVPTGVLVSNALGGGALGKGLGALVGATTSLFIGGGAGFPIAGKALQLYDRRVEQRDSVARMRVVEEDGLAEELLPSHFASVPQQVIYEDAETKV